VQERFCFFLAIRGGFMGAEDIEEGAAGEVIRTSKSDAPATFSVKEVTITKPQRTQCQNPTTPSPPKES